MDESRSDAVVRQIMDARTPDEIKAARKVGLAFLRENPDDIVVPLAMEQLAIMEFVPRQTPRPQAN